ncbi:hypothetical protein BuS5_00115 [Desulfosarcina sp. BuS5]|nr:hypothetical protein BuS5_00115 [Desulfosarcina sp. BuS5]
MGGDVHQPCNEIAGSNFRVKTSSLGLNDLTVHNIIPNQIALGKLQQKKISRGTHEDTQNTKNTTEKNTPTTIVPGGDFSPYPLTIHSPTCPDAINFNP